MSLHETLTNSIQKAGEEKVIDLIMALLVKKCRKKGIKVSDSELRETAVKLANGETHVFTANPETEKAEIVITSTESDRLEAQLNSWIRRVERKLPKVYNELADEAATELVKRLLRRQKSHVAILKRDREIFEKRLQRIWGKPLEHFERFLAAVEDTAVEIHNEAVDSKKTEDIQFEVLFRLVVRGIQVAKEVLVLMRSGYADGAHARWRSLHEIAVVGMFIEKHGKDVAERYLAHDDIEYYKGAVIHNENAKALNRRVIPSREMTRYKKKRDAAVAKYGGYFHRGDYGWASAALSNKKDVRFSDIEANVGQSKWRHIYKMASWNVHATSSGITSKMGLMDEHQDHILLGASLYGFTDPAHGSSTSLMYLISTLINLEVGLDRQIQLLTLIQLNRLIGEEFLAVQDSFVAQ